jgi:hypothetical protein
VCQNAVVARLERDILPISALMGSGSCLRRLRMGDSRRGGSSPKWTERATPSGIGPSVKGGGAF